MEQQQQHGGNEKQNDRQQNANNAYSGSGRLGNNAESKKLSDDSEGNLDEVKSQADSIPANQTNQPVANR